jgi:hypothetical protein
MVCLMCSSLVDNFYQPQPLVDNLIVWGQAPLRHRPTPLPHPQTKMGSAIPRPYIPVSYPYLVWSRPSASCPAPCVPQPHEPCDAPVTAVKNMQSSYNRRVNRQQCNQQCDGRPSQSVTNR